jgi:2,4-diketo-3-deoxy-L-fuconate hydrolase
MAFVLANVNGRASLVEGPHYFDLEELTRGRIGPDPMAALSMAAALHELETRTTRPHGLIEAATLGPPVPRPSQVFGIGLNYRAHLDEFQVEPGGEPLVFAKFPGSIAGPTDEIRLRGDRVDWEVELVVVIGQRAKDVPRRGAWPYVAGLCIGQDISDRARQFAGQHPQFCLAKSFDSYAPIGPFVVSTTEAEESAGRDIQCHVSGELMQSSRTDRMLYDIPRLIECLSSVVTLQPGDLIFTGTPDGVGMARNRYLRHGDVVVSSITGLGRMTNRCVADFDDRARG